MPYSRETNGRARHAAPAGTRPTGYARTGRDAPSPRVRQRSNPYLQDSDFGAEGFERQVSRSGSYARQQSRMARREAQRRRRRRRVAGIAAAVVVAAVLVVALLVRAGAKGRTPVPGGSGASQPPEETTVVVEPSPAEQRIEAVRERAAANCTREQPSGLTDPADYAELGRQTMEGIAAACGSWEGFDNAESFSLDARTDWDGNVVPYLLAVNRAANVVTAYALDADGRYTVPYQAMICSTGDYTPIGFYVTDEKYGWLPLFEEVYGQYATHIVGNILFHSVPYYNPYKDDVEYAEFNKLGTAASLGCVRLQACDIKWIYDICPLGTPVVIYDDADNPSPMGRPGSIATSETDTDPASGTYRGFDPTDPDPANPWDDRFVSGTAIRSDAAQADWDAAWADGRWAGTINPTELLGSSTSAESRG